jgi:hypothetical protein
MAFLVLVIVLAVGELTSAQTTSAQTPGAVDQAAPTAAAEQAGPSRRLTWAVSERVRYAGLFNQFRPGLSGDDRSIVFRTTLKGGFEWRRVTLVGELQDARAYLTDEGSYLSTALINAVDLLQAYVQVNRATTSAAWAPEVQLGRFTMELGSGRLIAQEQYRDVTRTFTGAKVRWPRIGGGALTALAVLPVAILPEAREGLLRNRIELDTARFNQKFWGAHYERPRLWLGHRGEAYFYALGEHDDPGRRETRDRELWTAGVRVLRPATVGDWDVDVESAWQRGSTHGSTAPADRRALDVSARLLHLQGGYTFDRRWLPRLGVEYEYGSGDANPVDGAWNRFDGLFGHRRVELAPTSIYGALGRENIDTYGVRLQVAPSPRTDAFAVYRVLRLAAAADAFANTGVRDPSGRSGREGGQQIDLRFRTWIKPGQVRMEFGVTHLIAGHFLKVAPNATREGNTTFFYADVTYSLASKPSRIF